MEGIGNNENRQQRNRNALRVHVGPPAKVESQRDFVLRILRQAGNAGVNRDCFLSGTGPCAGRRCTQVGARLDELTKMGYIFESKLKAGDQFVTYWLRAEPSQPQQVQVMPPRKPVTAVAPPAQQANLGLFDLSTASGTGHSFLAHETGRNIKVN